jgi:hypothetical protein
MCYVYRNIRKILAIEFYSLPLDSKVLKKCMLLFSTHSMTGTLPATEYTHNIFSVVLPIGQQCFCFQQYFIRCKFVMHCPCRWFHAVWWNIWYNLISKIDWFKMTLWFSDVQKWYWHGNPVQFSIQQGKVASSTA